MSHDAVETKVAVEVEKGSLLQALAVQEIEESHSLAQAKIKAEQILADAKRDAQSQLEHLPQQLKQLETGIIHRESDKGGKEAFDIQIRAEDQLTQNKKGWQQRVDHAAQNLVKRVLKVGS